MKDAAVDYLNIVVGQQSWAPELVVTGDNKVGVGTLSPQNKLDVGSGTGTVYSAVNGGNSGTAGGQLCESRMEEVDAECFGKCFRTQRWCL